MSPVNPDLARERKNATFNPEDLSIILYGKENLELRRKIFKEISEDPNFAKAKMFPTMSRDEVYEEAVRIFGALQRKMKEHGYVKGCFDTYALQHYYYKNAAFIGTYPFSVHTDMYAPTIKGQGTDEQIAEFLPKAETYQHIGTYAQTELGHGTFIRGLETTATYDKNTEEFVIHSPTITSIKYWPGGLGKTSNYAVVMAQLIIDGKNYGLHPFMCQLRDLKTHQPLAGIELGDINRKFGYEVVDNGYLRFFHYRIPRTNMLMRNAKVSKDGEFSRQAIPQVTYLTMSYVRMGIVQEVATLLAQAATIATRYSAVRRQTANSQGIEPQILDYQTQQMKVIPAICTSYAFFFNGFEVRKIYDSVMAAVEKGDVSRLPEMHSLTSGLKAYCSDVSCDLVEICRRSCGGHGYSNASGITRIYQLLVPCCTFEGENTVLYLQCARSLMKFLGKAQKGEELPSSLQFLGHLPDVPPELMSAVKFDMSTLMAAFQLNALRSVLHVASELQTAQKKVNYETAWNNNLQGLVEAAKMYSVYLVAKFFVSALSASQWESRAKAVLAQVCEFYLVNNILDHSGTFLQNDVLNPSQVSLLRTRRIELLAELRPNAVALVDAFDYPDRLLNSCLGRYDGNVYEALYEYAKSSSLNQHQVHPSFHKYVKPMRETLKSQL